MKNNLILAVICFVITVVVMQHVSSQRAIIIDERHAQIAERDAKLQAAQEAKETDNAE